MVVPGDGGISFTSKEELGEVTAKLLVSSNKYKNQTILLKGSRAYTLEETAELVSKILRRDIPVRMLSSQDYVVRSLKVQDEVWVRLWATTYGALARGELARVDSTLEKIFVVKK